MAKGARSMKEKQRVLLCRDVGLALVFIGLFIGQSQWDGIGYVLLFGGIIVWLLFSWLANAP